MNEETLGEYNKENYWLVSGDMRVKVGGFPEEEGENGLEATLGPRWKLPYL